MIRVSLTLSLLLVSVGSAFGATPHPALSAADIVNKNVAARGGAPAWRLVQSLSLRGKLGAGGNQRAHLPEPLPGKTGGVLPTDPRPKDEVQLPFLMEMERPLKSRLELQFKGQTAVQVFDGTNGWKLRPYLNRVNVETYTAEEMKRASLQSPLDGPLIDYAARGTTIALEGMEKVDDQNTYKLKLTLKSGQTMHVWIDAQTFLEAKIEGQPRRLDGVEHPVEVYYKDYRAVAGLKMPFALETHVLPVVTDKKHANDLPVQVEQITIERALINPKFEPSLFAKPELLVAKAGPAR